MSPATIRNFVITALIMCISTGGFIFMLFQIQSKEKVLQDQLLALNDELARGDSFSKLQKVAEESTTDRNQLDTYFLRQDSDSIDVLNLVESMAPKAKVALQTKGLQKITDKDTKTDWVEVSFVFSGQREDVEKFVAILERLPYLSYITSLTISAKSAASWEAQVTLRAYIYSYDT